MPACDLRCDRVAADRLRCFRKHLCGACVTKVLKLDLKRQRFYVACPFCRRRTPAAIKRVKKLMDENCPDHAKVTESENGPVAVVRAQLEQLVLLLVVVVRADCDASFASQA